jgi:hypothetical protein
MKLPANKSSTVAVQRALSSLKTLPRYLLLQKVYTVEIAILLTGLLIGLYFITRLLFLEPATPQADTTQTPRLSTDLVDVLELWIEEREAERNKLHRVGDREYFVVPEG